MATFDALIEAQLDGATVRAAPLVVLNFKSGTVRAWQGFGDLVAGDGYTYRGVGEAGSLSSIGSGPGGGVDEVTLQLAGGEELLADIEGDAEESAGQSMALLWQFFETRQRDEQGNWVDWKPIDEPLSLFVGTMGPMTIKREEASGDGRATRIVSVPCASILKNRARPASQFFADRDQKSRSPDDNICLRISQYSEGSVRWPAFGSGST